MMMDHRESKAIYVIPMKYQSFPIATQTRYPFQKNKDPLSNTIHQIDMRGKSLEEESDTACTSHQLMPSASPQFITSVYMEGFHQNNEITKTNGTLELQTSDDQDQQLEAKEVDKSSRQPDRESGVISPVLEKNDREAAIQVMVSKNFKGNK